MQRIQRVIPKSNYRIEVLLENGHSVTLNMENRLNTLRFSPLADYSFFKRVSTDGNFIHWERNIEISVTEVFQLAQK